MSIPRVSARHLTDATWANRAIGGVFGGLAGGLAMGVLLQLGTDLLPVFGQIFGAESLLLGWIVHLATSVFFGLLFAAFVSLPLVGELEQTISTSVFLAVIHATVLSYVTIGVILPLATITFGVAELSALSDVLPGPGIANLAGAAFFGLGHVVYGIFLGAVYTVLEDLERE